MKSAYPKIFEPITIKRTTIKNRIAMTPMGTNYGETSGEMSNRHMNYYSLRAKGGVGLIILENANIEYPVGSNGTSQIRIDHDSFMPRYYQLVENLHKNGATVAIQINHAGASASSARTGMETVSSSNIPTKAGGETPRPMTKEEIMTTVKKYGEAAKRVQAIGFDAIEIHCGHSYLMSQFISPYYNKRTDEFGGSVENRLRFPRMVLEEVRKNVGPWFPIIVRISAEERVPGGNTLEDTLEYLEYLDEFVDMYDVSCGLNPSLQYQIDSNFLPDGWRSYMARAVKNKFKKPVINAGNYRDPKVVEKVLESGDVDIVGMGRGLIAEPNWVKKVENGEEDLLRKCISCNVGCAGNRIGVNRPIRCTVNPAVPEGDIYKALKVNKNCNIVVVGAGTAGMEAACTAAEVGCNVFVLEKNDHIGGLSTFISDLPSKTRMKDFPKYLEARAARLKNLYIFLNTEATVDKIKQFKPDIIVNSTGSVPLVPPIKGMDGEQVVVVNELYRNLDKISDKVVVMGGGLAGCECAISLGMEGKEVQLVEMRDALAPDANVRHRPLLLKEIEKQVKAVHTGYRAEEITPEGVWCTDANGERHLVEGTTVICALGQRARTDVVEQLRNTAPFVRVIGDARRVSTITNAVYQGYHAALDI